MCTCIKQLNEQLAPRNLRIDVSIGIDFASGQMYSTLAVPTVITERKRGQKPVPVLASYCPFCGEKWPNGRIPDAAEQEGAHE